MQQLKNKLTLITGASSGIGKACAELFASAGSDLIITARRENRINELADSLTKKYGIKVLSKQLDVRNLNDVKAFVNSLQDEWKNIDILINNAGLARGFDKIHEGDISHWEEMIDTNIKGLLYITRFVLPLMIKRNNGHIINIGSTAGHETYPKGNVYSSTKFAVKALSQSTRLDVLDKGIKVTSVDPGMVNTEFSSVRFSGNETKASQVYKGLKPLTPEDVADAVLYSATRPEHVNINEIILTPLNQASSTQVYREE